MRPVDALGWLVKEGFAEANELGLTRIVGCPNPGSKRGRDRTYAMRDLHTFVLAIKTLGACSVSGAAGGPPAVEVSRGVEGDEIVFKLRPA